LKIENGTYKVRMTRVEQVDGNPWMLDWVDADHWYVMLGSDSGVSDMELHFSKGKGHNGEPPTLDEVLDCLRMDARGAEAAESFEDWAADTGHNPDSRKAERLYRHILSQSARLAALMGAGWDAWLNEEVAP